MYERQRDYQRDTSYLTLPNQNRSRSLNHYYNQANEFQKRYQNSLYNNYRIKKKCPPCCSQQQNTTTNALNSPNATMTMYKTSNVKNTNNNRSNFQGYSPYEDESQQYIKNQIQNLQNSKRFLQELIQKNRLQFKMKLQKSDNEVQILTSSLQRKNGQINELTKEISKLKKMSFYNQNQGSFSLSPKKTISIQSHTLQIAAKQQIIKQLQRKVSQLNQQNIYFEEDIQLKSQEILQLKSKGKLLQEKQQSLMKNYQNQIQELKQNNKNFLQRIHFFQNKTKEKDKQIDQLKIKIDQYSEKEVNNHKRFKQYEIIVARQRDQNQNQNIQKNMYESQVKKLQLQCNLIQRKFKDRQVFIDQLQSRINCLQSQLNFFKDKFHRLLYELQKEQAQSMTMIQRATILREKGERIYQQIQKVRQSQIYDRQQTNRNMQYSEINFNLPDHSQIKDKIQGKATQSKLYNRNLFGYESIGTGFGSPQKHENNYNNRQGMYQRQYNNYDFLQESRYQPRNRQLTSLPSMTMSISPIRHN